MLTPALAATSGLAASLLSAALVALPAAASPAGVKSMIITGSNSGIGYDAAQKLVAGGHQVHHSAVLRSMSLHPIVATVSQNRSDF
jgi:hypothetical protein